MRPVHPLAALAFLLVACAPAPVAPVAPAETPTPPAPSPSYRPAAPAGAFLFYENFEHGADRWQWTAGAADAVVWRLLKSHSCSGDFTMFVGKENQVPFTGPAETAVLALKAPLDLGRGIKPVLTYQLKGIAAPEDAVSLQPEVNEGGGAWQPAGDLCLADHDFSLTFTADLAAYAGKQVGLRFRVVVGATQAPTKGIYLDEVTVLEPRS